MLQHAVGSQSSSWRLAPGLHVRGPTHGVLDAPEQIEWAKWIRASGVREPTVLAINLEGRFATPAALIELVAPLAQSVSSGQYGQLALVFCTPDEATKAVLAALAEAHGATFFIANSIEELREAEPAGPLTAGERETLRMLRELGGRTTASVFAAEASLEPSAANNRLVNVSEKGLVQWQDRPRPEGKLYFDPRTAIPAEDPADPTAADFELPEEVRNDMRALAELRGSDTRSLYAEALGEFLSRNNDYLSEEHERLRRALAENDTDALRSTTRRHAKKQAAARAREIRRRAREGPENS
jgi:HPt (histidine-containing phosphotransfer) domain-containing protein